ncbi:hypothetical protein [Nocardia shimofusensis]|uniref:hypothetical protein n=1 Tax=Nocardia shimofusensis TaxID=228596 RepID=UPI000A82EE37|nr:hypothetical protein [Nocardia shimofusensis]
MSVAARLVLVLAVSFTAVGCSAAESEPWTPPKAPEAETVTTFGRPVPTADYAKLEVAAQVRSVDPCALLDPGQFARFGTLRSAGPYDKLSDCVVRIDVPGSPAGADVQLDLVSYEPNPDEETVTIAGQTVVRTSHYGCGYKVPMEFGATEPSSEPTAVPDIVEVPPTPYLSISASGFPASTGGNCGVLRETIARILTAFVEDRVPRRSQSPTQLALADRSPCELLEHLPADVPAERFDVTTDPYDCEFWSGKNIIHMKFYLTSPRAARAPFDFEQAETIAGYLVLVQEDTKMPTDPRCTFRFSVGSAFDHDLPEQKHVQPVGQLSGSCEITRAMIPTALEVFGANR